MAGLAIAMDLGTSGFRAQAIDRSTGSVISTAITTRHPLPGANVMDHVHFALDLGVETAQRLIIRAANRVLASLGVPLEEVGRLALCGNPTQLALLQGTEIRDLAFAGRRKLRALGVLDQVREARVLEARALPDLDLPVGCEVLIPPAVRHEVGADALAMIIQSGILERDETAISTDFGTNAEMAIVHRRQATTGSSAAGAALEGQHLTFGMLAVPGAISDLEPEPPHHRIVQLDDRMLPIAGSRIDLERPGPIEAGAPRPAGITGTGALAILEQAIDSGLVEPPRISTADARLHLGEEIYLSEEDVVEAGKAIGAVRAGHITLCHEAGIALDQVRTAYISGASGTYVDARKAQRLGLIPPQVRTVYQLGNTSLAMARDLALVPGTLERMSALARQLRQRHCLFGASPVFKRVFLLELAYWVEGMPLSQYREFLARYGLPALRPPSALPQVVRTVERDLGELGRLGLKTVSDPARSVQWRFPGCTGCSLCLADCPEGALSLSGRGAQALISLDPSRCDGVGCRRCERACPEKVFRLDELFRG